jgi:hypothetical protein
MMFAGHCITNGGGLGTSWLHNGTPFGTANSNQFVSGSSTDSGYILLSAGASPGNQLFVSTSDVRSMTGFVPNISQTLGTWVCKSGRTTNYTCGQIVDEDASITVDSVPLTISGSQTTPRPLEIAAAQLCSPTTDMESTLGATRRACPATPPWTGFGLPRARPCVSLRHANGYRRQPVAWHPGSEAAQQRLRARMLLFLACHSRTLIGYTPGTSLGAKYR